MQIFLQSSSKLEKGLNIKNT